MANEIVYHGNENADSGKVIVARVFNTLGIQVGTDITLTEVATSAIYIGDMVAGQPLGSYVVKISEGVIQVGNGVIYWDGTNEIDEVLLHGLLQGIPTNPLLDSDPILAGFGSSLTTIETNVANLNDFDPVNDVVARVTLVDTTTVNTDMRGTDGANTQTPLTAAQVNSEVDIALGDYDAPTKAELDAAEANIIANAGSGSALTAQQVRDAMKLAPSAGAPDADSIDDKLDNGISAPSASDIYSYFTSANREDLFKADIAALATAASISALNDLSSADITAAVPTASQIAAVTEAALINEGDGQQLIDAIVTLINSNLDLPALELQAIASQVRTELATELGRLDVAVSTRATPANITSAQSAIQADISGLNDPTVASIVSGILAATISGTSGNTLDDVLNEIWNTLEQDGITVTSAERDLIASRTRDYILSTETQSATPVGGIRSHTP